MNKGEGEYLRTYLKKNKLNQEQLATALGITRQGLNYHFLKEKLDYEFKMLLRNHGVKLFDENGKINFANNIVSEPTVKLSSRTPNAILLDENDYMVMMVPLVNKYAYAGYQAGYGDDEYIESLPRVPLLVNKEHKGNYRAFEIRGESMNNGLVGSYQEGYTAFGREIPRHHWRDKLHYKQWPSFIVVTKSDGILIKEITKHDVAKGIITLHSWNDEYEDIEMALDEVKQLFNTVKVDFVK
jgi:DNA-binding XRE family transcriptional regulator